MTFEEGCKFRYTVPGDWHQSFGADYNKDWKCVKVINLSSNEEVQRFYFHKISGYTTFDLEEVNELIEKKKK